MRAAIKKVIAMEFGGTGRFRNPAPLQATTPDNDLQGTALVVTTDTTSAQWAPRWLRQAGLDTDLCNDAAVALDSVDAMTPSVIIVDAAMRTNDGTSLLQALRKQLDQHVPIIALCAGNAETVIATEADATDIVRRPYDWDVITRRIVRAIKAHRAINDLRDAQENLERINAAESRARRNREKCAGLDKLTQLPNGEKFRSLLHKATASRRTSNNEVCLLVIGLDNFRLVNDAVGIDNANRLLKLFSDRLRRCLRDRRVVGDVNIGTITAIAARLGGARFALMISEGNTDQIMKAVQAIDEQMDAPFEVAGQSIYLTTSIGAAVFPRDCTNADALLFYAESAMREAQDTGSGLIFHTRPSDASSAQLLKLDGMLREALRNGDLNLAYQPILDTQSGDVVAAEALLRWHHVEEGPMSPADFVPVAERTGLMREIGTFVIKAACAQLRSWIDVGMAPIRIAVNLSLCQLLRDDVPAIVAAALEEHQLDPALLEFELSERGVLTKRPEVIEQVHRLKALGVRISIDDFGTGQAAIGYLKDLPIDVIKIDRSYVSGKGLSARDEAIASGMVALAKGLNATVISEGVETEEQLQKLRKWGSQEYQGFYFSPAVPASEFRKRFA
mgnify:CR=1 FL=1